MDPGVMILNLNLTLNRIRRVAGKLEINYSYINTNLEVDLPI